MARSAALLLLFAVGRGNASVAAGRNELAVTPIQKVLTLMTNMLEKGKKEKQDEATKFSAFSMWCSDQKRTKTGEIQQSAEHMEMLNAEILKAESSIRGLTDRMQELDEDVGRWTKDKASATEVRQKEETDYLATLQDYSESIDALTEAVSVLKKQAFDRPQTGLVQTLLQLKSKPTLPQAAKSALTAFLQQSQPDELSTSAPEANSYEFQSGGVIDMLVKLKDQFDQKRADLMSEEMKSKHAYDMIMQQLTDNSENANHEVSKKTEVRANTQQVKAQKQGDLAQTTEDKNADSKYLENTVNLCDQKSTDFESRQELRAGEIEALSKAIDIISSGTVAGSGDKHLSTLIQSHTRTARSLAQVSSGSGSPLQARIAAFLAERARISGSRLLAQVSQHVADDPFQKVKKLIKDLISQLMEEGTAETEHKGWCDTELTTNKQTRDAKSAEVSSLQAAIEDYTAQIAQLTQDLSDLAGGVQELDAAMAKATDDRTESKATNEQTIKEAKEAQMAVGQAIAVVKEFYAKSAQATVLTQQTPDADAPETFDKPYKGMMPEGGNVADFLEVILTDFTRLESDTASSEATEQDTFDKFMFESRKDKALKENMMQHKQNTKTDRESALHTADEELKSTQDQLSAAVAYFEKLKPTCVDSGITFEERTKRREAEMQSLQEALKILSGEDIA